MEHGRGSPSLGREERDAIIWCVNDKILLRVLRGLGDMVGAGIGHTVPRRPPVDKALGQGGMRGSSTVFI